MQHHLCKNCEHTFEGNFCSNCGQKTNTKRLDWSFVFDELKYTLLHLNGGFLYTCKQLITRPGDMVREFLEGKRVKHYKPILLVFVLAGLNGFLSLYIKYENYIPKTVQDKKLANQMPKMINWLFSNYATVELALLPVFSICSWIVFKKYGYNYIENIIINCFASAQRLILGLVTIPILYFIDVKNLMTASNFLSIPVYGISIWLYIQLYKKHKLREVLLRVILFCLLTIIGFFTVITTGTLLYLFIKN